MFQTLNLKNPRGNKTCLHNRTVALKRAMAIMAVFFGLASSMAHATQAVQTGRYTSVAIGATTAQINPLAAIAQFHFPPSVQTVGGAITIVLSNTGYRLAPQLELSTDVQTTLKMPLPMTDRTLGFITIQDALDILMGKIVYRLQVDPLKRTVNFSFSPWFQPALPN